MGMTAVQLDAYSVVKLFAFLSIVERTLSGLAGCRGRGSLKREAMDLGSGAKIHAS